MPEFKKQQKPRLSSLLNPSFPNTSSFSSVILLYTDALSIAFEINLYSHNMLMKVLLH